MFLNFESIHPNSLFVRGDLTFLVCPFCFDTRSIHLAYPTWVIVNKAGTQICMNCYILTRPKGHQAFPSVSHVHRDSPWYNDIDRHLEAFRRDY